MNINGPARRYFASFTCLERIDEEVEKWKYGNIILLVDYDIFDTENILLFITQEIEKELTRKGAQVTCVIVLNFFVVD